MRRSALAALLVAVTAACSSGSSNHAAPNASTTTTSPAVATIAWSRLHNPVLTDPTHGIKDPALVAVGSEWVALFSRVDRSGTWRIGIARSPDLVSWSPITEMPHDPTTQGEASPDVVHAPNGSYVVAYQSFPHDRAGGQAKLYARTSPDLRSFSAPIRLLANVDTKPGDRLIDAALVYSPIGLMLGFKTGTTDAGSTQHFTLARSLTGSLAGPWQIVGEPAISVYGDTIENYEFLTLAHRPAMLATSNQFDRPELFRVTGDARTPSGWLRWSPAQELHIPQERWNPGRGLTGSTFEHANSAYIVGVGDENYAIYEDAPDMTSFGSQGRGVLAIARSPDLVHWEVPG